MQPTGYAKSAVWLVQGRLGHAVKGTLPLVRERMSLVYKLHNRGTSDLVSDPLKSLGDLREEGL